MTNAGRLSCLLVMTLVACGGGGGGAVTVSTAPTDLATASCGYTFRCCTDAEIMTQFKNLTLGGQPITTEAQCTSTLGGLLQGLALPEWNASISEGRMSFDANAASSCIDAIDNLGCGGAQDISTNSDCMPFLIPLVDNAGACSQSYECKGGLCEKANAGSGSDGVCADLPTAGEACDFDCAKGLYCDFGGGGSTGACVATKAGGTSCGANDECQSTTCDTTTTMTCIDSCTGR